MSIIKKDEGLIGLIGLQKKVLSDPPGANPIKDLFMLEKTILFLNSVTLLQFTSLIVQSKLKSVRNFRLPRCLTFFFHSIGSSFQQFFILCLFFSSLFLAQIVFRKVILLLLPRYSYTPFR